MNAPATSNRSRLERILETSLYAQDLDRAEQFYKTALGLELFAKETGRHVFFRCGAQMLLIFHPDKTNTESDTAPHGAHGPGHVAFAVPMSELTWWKSHLQTTRIEIEKDVTWPNGGRSIYLRDPAGNCLELASPLVWGMAEDER